MGQGLAKMFEGKCLHDLYFYVLNDSECHSNCAEVFACDCETHKVESTTDDSSSEISIEVESCCHARKT